MEVDCSAGSSKEVSSTVDEVFEPEQKKEKEVEDNDVLRPEDRCFTPKSINIIAATMGISNITSDAAQHLADDLLYKIKELLFNSRLVMYRNKQGKMTTDDIHKALNIHSRCYLFGHDSKKDFNYIYAPKADVYIEEDTEIELAGLAMSNEEYMKLADAYMQGSWTMAENSQQGASNTQFSSYYLKIAKTIMSGNPSLLKVALSDLRTNPKIGPVCPYFLNLVALTIKKIPRSTRLTNALIGTIHSIVHNKYVDPSPYVAVSRAANSLVKIALEVNGEKGDDDLGVRTRAGLLLSKVIMTWSIELKQKVDIVHHLLQRLLDPKLPLQSHYGAIITLTALGHRTLDYYLWPVMEGYLTLLENRSESKIMIQHIMVAILVAERSTRRKDLIMAEQLAKLSKVDQMLYSKFGDTVTPFRMIFVGPPVYPCIKREPNLSRLRLRIQKVSKSSPKRININSVFDISFKPRFPPQMFRRKKFDLNSMGKISFRVERKLPPAMYLENSRYRNKIAFAYATRNYRFCSKLHKTSPAGDLLMLI